MSRPLKYDDQFISIINQKFHQRFLCFKMKVQRTAFFQKLNLQKALFFCAFVDFIIGLIIFLLFFKILQLNNEANLFFIENLILIVGMIFGLVGIDASSNLRKLNSNIYKYWRMFITFYIPLSELVNFKYNGLCYYDRKCTNLFYFLISFVCFCVNIYFTKTAWSFCIRLNMNHELLIIHGKYLEQMIKEENYKINENCVKKYIPNQYENIKNYKHQNEFLKVANTETGHLVEEVFNSKSRNPFLPALKSLKIEINNK